MYNIVLYICLFKIHLFPSRIHQNTSGIHLFPSRIHQSNIFKIHPLSTTYFCISKKVLDTNYSFCYYLNTIQIIYHIILMERKLLQFRLLISMHNELESIAKSYGMKTSELVRFILIEWLKGDKSLPKITD